MNFAASDRGVGLPFKTGALRRHHRLRLLARARNSVVASSFEPGPEREHFAVRHSENPAKCSCWMCGNPRKWSGMPSLREIRDDLDFKIGEKLI